MQSLARSVGVTLATGPQWDGGRFGAFMELRRYMHENVMSNAALRAKHLRYQDHASTPSRRYMLSLALLVNQCASRSRSCRAVARFIDRLALRDSTVARYLRCCRPRVLVTTYPVNAMEAVYLAEARRAGITTVTQLLSWDNITCKGYFPAVADYFLSWGPIMTEELKKYYGIAPRRIFETGVAHFDAHVTRVSQPTREATLLSMGLSAGRPYILYGLSSPYFTPNEIDIVERLATRVRGGAFGSEMQLVVRPHPQNMSGYYADEKWLPRLNRLVGPRVGVAWPAMHESELYLHMDSTDISMLVNLLAGATCVVNSGSTLCLDALAHDKAVVLTPFDGDEQLPWHNSARRVLDYGHLVKLIGLGGVEIAKSYSELEEALRRLIIEPGHHAHLRRATLERECGPIDGHSSARIANALAEISALSRHS